MNEKRQEEPSTRCSEAGFEHAWEKMKDHPMAFPPTDPCVKCLNCGLVRFSRSDHKYWFEYYLPPFPVASSKTMGASVSGGNSSAHTISPDDLITFTHAKK